jgi:uncharacterized protein YkwD
MNRRYSRPVVLAFFIIAGCNGPIPVPPTPPNPPVPPTPAAISQQLLDAHNKARSDRGLPPFKANADLQKAADSHAAHMASVGIMAHEGIGDGTPWTRITATGYTYSAAGENIEWGSPDVPSVMSVWLASPGHLANIVGDYSDAGLAMAKDSKGGVWWCVDFGTSVKLKETALVSGVEPSASSTSIKVSR